MYLTNFPRDDGFGAQYQTILFTIMYCGMTGYDFAYSPFVNIAHNYDNDVKFIEDKENLINLRNNFLSIYDVEKYEVVDSFIYHYVESRLDACLQNNLFLKAKGLFFKNKPIREKDDRIHVAVHVRKVNQSDIGDYGYVGNDYFVNKIKRIRLDKDTKTVFHIYSQGTIEDFPEFISEDTVFHLNESVEKTFYGMASADVLIMSKSSFSYCAALLSNGEIHYLPFWHRKASHWIG